jgi:hypothetical protein
MLLGGLWTRRRLDVRDLGRPARRVLGDRAHARRETPEGSTGVRRVLRTALTFYLVCIAWVFFRAQSVDAALITLRSFVLWQFTWRTNPLAHPAGVLVLLAVTHVLAKRNVGAQRWRKAPTGPSHSPTASVSPSP